MSSCKTENKELKSTEEEYFYKVSYTDSNRVDYSVRRYQFYGDTIKLEAKRFNELGQVVTSNGEGGLYIIDNNDIRLLGGSRKEPIVKGVVFSIKKQDSCWTYFHPYYSEMKNCYRGLTNDGTKLVFSSEQQADDGISRVLYLDKNYTLVRETSDSPLEKFREMIRIDKSKVPKKVLSNIN